MGNILEIAVQDITPGDGPLEERLLTAMKEARHHWLLHNDDQRFQAAVAAVLFSYPADSEEYKTIIRESNVIRAVSILMSGIPVDMEAVVASVKGKARVELMKLWASTEKEKPV